MTKDYDVAIVGGGLLGSAIAWGLGRLGQSVAVLDEGDITKRASRANFALVWVQSKGLGMPAYTGWTVRASQAWPRLAAELKDETGLDVALQQNGGFHLTLGEAEFAQRTFPHLARLNVVRTWAGIRVMPRDGFPIYDQSETHPGAFVACCHSGVTLAPNHAFDIARMVKRGALETELVEAFSARRFATAAASNGTGY